MKNIKYRKLFISFLPILSVLLGALMMALGGRNVMLADVPVPTKVVFTGEYSRDGENWYELRQESDLSARKGDICLRGHLDSKAPMFDKLCYFRDHISISVSHGGELVYSDPVLDFKRYGIGLSPVMCGRGWDEARLFKSLEPGDYVEIYIHNPHRGGNDRAYRYFLDTLLSGIPAEGYPEDTFSRISVVFRGIGVVSLIASVLLLGFSAAAILQRMPVGLNIGKLSLFLLFSGGFIIFDSLALGLWKDNTLFNTYGQHICMMLAVYFMGLCILDALEGRRQRLASAAVYLSGFGDAVLILLSLGGYATLFDLMPLWNVMQLLLCPLLAGLLISAYASSEKKERTGMVLWCLMLAAILLDITGFYGFIYSQAVCSILMFCIYMGYRFVHSTTVIFENNRASARARSLEKELEDSRISLMLSQIQPHFLYNVLGTIRGLCRQDPEKAWKALGDFSSYLRANMSSLSNKQSIHFSQELRHIETYLRLEQMRMGERLGVIFDIQEQDFSLPPLSVQPLVENSVKHGIFNAAHAGTVIVHSHREGNTVIISVEDDGVGFDVNAPCPADDNREHVGISNVRSRIERLCGGSLTIESHPGKGTRALITFDRDGAV